MEKNVIAEVEKSLTEYFGKTVKVVSTRSIGGGCINHASKIETNLGPFFLKWNAFGLSDLFIREAESLQELEKAADGNLKIPKVFASKEVDGSPGFLVQEYLPPGSASNDEKMGRGLAVIHRYSGKMFGFYDNNYCGATLQNNSWSDNWIDFFTHNRLAFLLDLIKKERPLPADDIKIYIKLLERLPALIPQNSTPVLIHGDLWSGNYMNTTRGPALIDPASYYADAEMEFAISTMFGGFSSRFYSAYFEVNPLPHDWEDRNRLYQIYHVLNHYYLFGGSYRQQALSIAKSYL